MFPRKLRIRGCSFLINFEGIVDTRIVFTSFSYYKLCTLRDFVLDFDLLCLDILFDLFNDFGLLRFFLLFEGDDLNGNCFQSTRCILYIFSPCPS